MILTGNCQKCNGLIEFDDNQVNTISVCPICNQQTLLITTEIKQKLTNDFYEKHGICPKSDSFLKNLFDIYFDRNAISPPITSPYRIIIGILYSAYCLLVGMLLVGVSASFITIPIISLYNTPKIHIDNVMMVLFQLLTVVVGSIVFWYLIHICYKIVRVIFDIAEYLRQINK